MLSPESLQIFILLSSIILFILGFYKPIFMPLAFIYGLLSKVTNFYPILQTIKFELILGLGGLIVVLVKTQAFNKLSYSYNAVNKYFYLLLVSMLVSFLVAWDYAYSWDIKLYDFIKVVLMYFMIVMSIENKKDLKIFFYIFISLFIYLAYEPVFYFLMGTGGIEEMYGEIYVSSAGILSGHVALANNMNQMIPIVFYLFLAEKNKYLRAILLLALLFFFIALVGSKSRGGIAGFLFIMAAITYFSENRLRMGIIGAVAVLILFALNPDLGATFERIDSTASQGRFIGLIHGLEMVLKGNILGVGPGCYLIARSYYFSYYMESHNIYGQVLGDLGIPGVIVTFFFIKHVFKNLIETKNRLDENDKKYSFLFYLSLGIQVSLIVRLFVSMGSHGLYYFYWYVLAAVSIALYSIADADTFKTDFEQEKISI